MVTTHADIWNETICWDGWTWGQFDPWISASAVKSSRFTVNFSFLVVGGGREGRGKPGDAARNTIAVEIKPCQADAT